MSRKIITITIAAAAIFVSGCNGDHGSPVGSEGWLTGDVTEKFETVADHLGGFGKAMWEVDYRFQELWWAGQDGNWEYAAHQIEELEETLELGLERRPARAASAQQFMTKAIPDVEEAIDARNPEMFDRRINLMLNTCNSCHALEDMPFLTVKPPLQRKSTIR
ncbi:MAG: hypothetical protein EA408_05980 [Marinilabiliales bacterium]|nr:MAG: hypothetical protein EA408_05980 [Marinilabiliales bacterium]